MAVSRRNIDSGYAWVVLAAAFTLQFMAGILAYSPGVTNIAVLEEIENDLTQASWIGAVNFGTCSLLGPVAGLIQAKTGSRITAMAGGVLTLSGMTAASFCKSITTLVVTYGFISGFGICLACNVVVVAAGNYFDKRRAAAFGVCVAGGGMGLLVSGPLVRYLLNQYNLSGTLLILGAIEFHMCVAGVALRPPHHPRSQCVNITAKSDEECSFLHEERKLTPRTKESFITSANMHGQNRIFDDTALEQMDDGLIQQHGPSLDESHILMSQKSKPIYSSGDVRKVSRMCRHFYSMIAPLKGFLVYNISLMLWVLGESAAVFHLPNYAQQKGSSTYEAASLFTAMGVGSVFSRVATGMIASDPTIPYTVLHVGLAGLSGLVLLFFPLYSHHYSTQLVFGLLYGTYSQGINALMGPAITDLVAKEKLSIAYGFLYFFCGIGNILGPPAASWIYTSSGVYDFTYVFAGICLIMSSLSAATLSMVRVKEQMKQAV